MAKQQQVVPPAGGREKVATTYAGYRRGGKWRIEEVTLYADGGAERKVVLEHPERLVARERLRVLLDSREVMP